MFNRCSVALFVLGLWLWSGCSKAHPVLNVDAGTVSARVSPILYGLMTEEINHSYDGGLYAELIQNRIFKDDAAEPRHWSLFKPGRVGAGLISLDRSQPINDALTVCLKLVALEASSKDPVGIANDGYWGIPVKPSTTYRVSFYAKAGSDFTGGLTAALVSRDGRSVFAKGTLPETIGKSWSRYSLTLRTGGNIQPSSDNRFVILVGNPGTVWFNLVSVFPPTYNERPNGNRIDLMELLAAMKPAFLRLPGGDYLEGTTPDQRFAFKTTIHGLAERPGHIGSWGYRSSDGMGLLEFMEWCEDLHMQPLLAVFDGLTTNHQHINPGRDLAPCVQEALDEIEYVTGDARMTQWGGERAKDGHPAPFPLRYVEVGNEDDFDRSGSYEERYAQFYDAIKAKYPQLQLIATTPVTSRPMDLIDRHRYARAEEFEADANGLDSVDRTGPKIIMGEWASTAPGWTPDMHAALGDAAWLMSLERNSDTIIMESYAPLLVRLGGSPEPANNGVDPGGGNWRPDLIGYDGLNSYGSPSYYVQTMFAQNHGDAVLRASMEDVPKVDAGSATWGILPNSLDALYFNATRDTKSGIIYIKMVNLKPLAQEVRIRIGGVGSVGSEGTAITLDSSSLTDANSLEDPKKISPATGVVSGAGADFTYRFPGYSVTVLKLPCR